MSVNRIFVSFACLLGIAVSGVQAADQPKPAPTVKAADGKAPAKPVAADKAATKVDPKADAKAEPKALTPDPMDWPNWRGPEQNRISREKNLVDHWSPPKSKGDKGENVLWTNDELGGISTPIVMRGKLYTLVRAEPNTKREGEKVICVDAATGKKLWENRFNVYLSDAPAERVGWSSCVGDPTTGRVYALGVCGYFQCIDGDTGKTIWSRSLHEEFGLISTYGGRTNVPVIFENLAIISAVVTGWGDTARPAHRFMAFNKSTGELIWYNGTTPSPADTTYSTPTLANLAGQASLVFGSSDGAIWNFQPRTGKPIWNFKLSRRGLNVAPLIDGDNVYSGQGEENLDNSTIGCLVGFKGTGKGDITKTNELWKIKNAPDGKSTPVLVDGRLYYADDSANFYVVDAATGKQIGKPVKLTGTIVRGSPLYADGKIYMCTTNAWHCLKPTEKGVEFIQKFRLDHEDEMTASPIVSHGRIYLTTGARVYCIGAKDQKPSATEQPKKPEEKPIGDDTAPAWVQLTPEELIVKPGEKVSYKVLLFNDRGQALPDAKTDGLEFSLKGPGKIDSQGNFTAASENEHSATVITAKLGELTGTARVRTIPPLPWAFSFKDIPLVSAMGKPASGDAPLTWVGARVRHIIRELDGEKVMVKVTTIPLGTRSQSWMGPIDLHDYTIQADLRAGKAVSAVEGSDSDPHLGMPDMGVIAQRYTLDVMGAKQQLQIRSWPPQVLNGLSASVPFPWKIETWYTVKFQASVEGKKAVLRGKVWPKGEKEPEKWSIEMVDEEPNTHGSPGLFGNAANAEIFINNVTVTPNKAAATASK